jgi:hypothetical protein
MCNAALTPVLRHSTTATTAGTAGMASPLLQQQQQQQQRFAYTRVQLHTPQSRSSGSVTATPITASSVQSQFSSACRSTAGYSSNSRHSNAHTPTADSNAVASLTEATASDANGNFDWYRVVKEAVVAQRVANKWDTLRTGWQWLRTNLRASLRATAAAAATSSSSAVCFAVHEGDASLNRVVNKLTARGWVLLYESLKSEFSLGAEGLAREAPGVFTAQQQQQQHDSADSNITAGTDVIVLEPSAKRSRTETSIGNSCSSSSGSSNAVSTWESLGDVQAVKAVLWAWSAFRDWCEHIDERQVLEVCVIFGVMLLPLYSAHCV